MYEFMNLKSYVSVEQNRSNWLETENYFEAYENECEQEEQE
jgi:hypothetical protein